MKPTNANLQPEKAATVAKEGRDSGRSASDREKCIFFASFAENAKLFFCSHSISLCLTLLASFYARMLFVCSFPSREE